MTSFTRKATTKNVLCTNDSGAVITCRRTDGKKATVPQRAIDDDSEVWELGQFGKLVVEASAARKLVWK